MQFDTSSNTTAGLFGRPGAVPLRGSAPRTGHRRGWPRSPPEPPGAGPQRVGEGKGRPGGRGGGHSQVCQHGELGVGAVQQEVDEGAEPVAGAGGGCHGAGGRRGRC